MTKIPSLTERVFEKENSPTQEVLTCAHKLIALHFNDVAGKTRPNGTYCRQVGLPAESSLRVELVAELTKRAI